MAYAYITFGQLKSALLQRLQDTYVGYFTNTGSGFVSPTEAGLYLIEALRTLNAQAALWNADFVFNFAPADTWKSLNFTGSPRQRTVTDTDLYVLMQYHLLEPPTGAVWTGSTQFNITNMSQALSYRRSELMQASGANISNLLLPSPTASVRTVFPGTVIDLRRVRWIPATGFGTPYALTREDQLTFQAYANQDIMTVADPDSYSLTSDPPLAFDCNTIPPVPGTWDLLAVSAATNPLVPPATTVMELPNDWCWVAKWGALADMMANSPEGTDRLRAKYCEQRYEHGKSMMLQLPWLLNVSVQQQPTDTPSFVEADAYSQNWEQTWPIGDPQIVTGGMDLIALAPFVVSPNPTVATRLTVVGNAPIPAVDGDPIQLARDGVEAVLAYAQHLATFKNGGLEFAEAAPLLDQFERYCAQENSRYTALGIMRDTLIYEGGRGEDIDPRFAPQEKKQEAPAHA